MKTFAKWAAGCVLVLALSTTAVAQQAKPKIESLGWLAGTRYIDRPDGSRSYETWTGPTAGIVTGSVASPNNGGLSEFFRIGPNEKGEYGLATANSTNGLTNWRFQPLKSLEPGKVVFAAADGSSSFSIEAVPGGAIHNISMRLVDGKLTKAGEWMWLPLAWPK